MDTWSVPMGTLRVTENKSPAAMNKQPEAVNTHRASVDTFRAAVNKQQASVGASLQSTILKIFSKNMGKHLVVSEIVATFAIAYEK